jgi:hypothetical protein
MPGSARESQPEPLTYARSRPVHPEGWAERRYGIVRRRFFEAALGAGVGPDKACGIWNDAVFGDRYARQLIEKLCEIEIVAADAGFAFFE